jgi:uncharacterized membrane protein YraQ (UPF0718 family)
MERLTKSFTKTLDSFLHILPVILGVLALANLATALLPPRVLTDFLPLEGVFGPLFGSLAGSVAVGHPLTSYVLAGEFMAAGVDLATVTAFVVSWVTVGVAQYPAEAAMLGIRFAMWRNALALLFAIAIGYVVTLFVEGAS